MIPGSPLVLAHARLSSRFVAVTTSSRRHRKGGEGRPFLGISQTRRPSYTKGESQSKKNYLFLFRINGGDFGLRRLLVRIASVVKMKKKKQQNSRKNRKRRGGVRAEDQTRKSASPSLSFSFSFPLFDLHHLLLLHLLLILPLHLLGSPRGQLLPQVKF